MVIIIMINNDDDHGNNDDDKNDVNDNTDDSLQAFQSIARYLLGVPISWNACT